MFIHPVSSTLQSRDTLDTVYLFQIQILPVTLSDAQPKIFGTTFLFTFGFTCMNVDVCITVQNRVHISEGMSVQIHTNMWK